MDPEQYAAWLMFRCRVAVLRAKMALVAIRAMQYEATLRDALAASLPPNGRPIQFLQSRKERI